MTSGTGRSGIPGWMQDYLDAWNSHDPAKVLACMTDDVVFDEKGIGERLEGKDAVRAMLVDLTESMSSDYRLDWGDLIISTDDLWAAEWTMSGTNDREDKARGVPNTGRPFRIQGLSIGRQRDGQVTEEHLYWNLADYLTQIGVLPAAPAPATV
jgi:steroid delta-isomerase-like uncharacterized protein